MASKKRRGLRGGWLEVNNERGAGARNIYEAAILRPSPHISLVSLCTLTCILRVINGSPLSPEGLPVMRHILFRHVKREGVEIRTVERVQNCTVGSKLDSMSICLYLGNPHSVVFFLPPFYGWPDKKNKGN